MTRERWADRRSLLRYGAGVGLAMAGTGLAGCTLTDPTVGPSGSTVPPVPPPSPTPAAPPPPLEGSSAGAASEASAIAWCAALAAAATTYQLGAGQTGNLALAGSLHRRRLAVLTGPEPTTRPVPSDGPTAGTPTLPSIPPAPTLDPNRGKGFTAFRTNLGRLRAEHLGRVAGASGMTALLWASLAAGVQQSSVLADRAAAAPRPTTEASHPPYEPSTDVAAAQGFLAQLHALAFGLQASLAPLSGAAATPYQQRLVRARIQRDHLVAWLRNRGANVPVAEAEYDLGGVINSPAAALALVARMESALLPFAGDWVAAAEATERRGAAEWLADGAGVAVQAGAAPAVWPGWRN